MPIAERLQTIRGRIAAACERAGRDPAGVRVVGASAAFKGVSLESVEEALAAGLRDFGENRVQEAKARVDALGARAGEATWHLIGPLQRNKVRDALAVFDVIQTVDSVRLAEALNSRAARPLRLLLEVNVAGEASKFGFTPADVAAAVKSMRALPHIEVVGLMTVAPQVGDSEEVRPVFRALRELACDSGLTELSMGMTDDFEVAVEEGATMVRIGRAIFGERPS